MPTVGDFFRRTQTLIDDSLDNITMVDWFNQCQDNIADLLYIPTEVVIAKDVATGKFIVPQDENGEITIKSPAIGATFEILDGKFYFTGEADVSTITVRYNKLPSVITNNTAQVPDIKSQFHSVYVLYAAMMAMEADEESERYALYEKDFLRLRGQIDKYYGKKRPKPSSWEVVR